ANATGVPVNAAVSLQASSPVDLTTVSQGTFELYDTVLAQAVAGSYSLSPDGETVYLLPAAELATGRTYTVYFASYGMTDVAGNAITACCGYLNNFSFTTGFAASTTAPVVTGVSPSNGLGSVPLNAEIVVGFSEPVDAESLSGVTLEAGSTPVAVTATLSAGNQLMTVTPVQGLAPGAAYTLGITGVTDLAGNAMTAPFTSTFNTGSVPNFVQPVVTSITPNNSATGVATNSTIQIQFNKIMNPLTITGSTITVANGSTQVPGTVTVNAAGMIATFTPNAPLATTTVYSVAITSGITDLEGEALTAFTSTFTTGSQ
ncbi:MAG: Ig-like domain-containing protein, partial [Terracidiphilus sp.]